MPCSNPSRAHPVDMSQPQKPLPDVGVRAPTRRSLSDVGETGFTCRKPILIGVVLFFFRTSQSDGGDPPALGLIWEIWLPSSAFPNGKDLGSPWAESRGKMGGSSQSSQYIPARHLLRTRPRAGQWMSQKETEIAPNHKELTNWGTKTREV